MYPIQRLAAASLASLALFSGTAALCAEPLTINVGWVTLYASSVPLSLEKKELLKHYGQSYIIEPMRMQSTAAMITALATGGVNVGALWDQLAGAGVAGIKGVFQHAVGFVVVAIEQQYAGHDRQVGMAALGCAANAYGHYVVIVDDDIDPSDLKEVMWAITARSDPSSDITIMDNCRSTPMDRRTLPERRVTGPHVSGRAIIYATRPWNWRHQFPMVNRIDKDQRDAMAEKYRDLLPFPKA